MKFTFKDFFSKCDQTADLPLLLYNVLQSINLFKDIINYNWRQNSEICKFQLIDTEYPVLRLILNKLSLWRSSLQFE